MRHGVPEIEMNDDFTDFLAMTHNDKQRSRQISTIVFSIALVKTLLIKLGDSALCMLFGSYRKQNEYSFSLNVIFKRSRRSSLISR